MWIRLMPTAARGASSCDATMALMGRAGSILDRLAEDSPLQQRHRHQRDEYEDRHDRRIAEAEEFERRVVEQHDDRLAGARRPALRGGVDLVEDLEVENELEYADHDDLRVEQGQRDVPELLPSACAIDPRRLVLLLRNSVQLG